jgi:type I restriction enzyme, S subunit
VSAEVKEGYRRTEAGLIPLDWKARPLLDAIRIASGQVDPKVEPYKSMILVAPDHIESTTGRLLKQQTAADQGAISGKYLFEEGDVVYSKIRPYLRKAILAKFDGLCSADMYPLRAAKDVSAGFMLSVLLGRHFSEYAESVSVRSGMPKVNRAELAEYVVALPPTKGEQEAIAEALCDTDFLIEALEQLIAKKRHVKQGAMQQLLTGDARLPGFEGGWESRTFGDLFEYCSTATNSRADLVTEGEAYYVHYGDIHTKFHAHLDFRRDRPPMIDRHRCRNATRLRNGDWVMADASEDLNGVAKAVEILGLPEGVDAVAGLHTFLLRERGETYIPGFKGHLGGLESLHQKFLRVVTGMKVFGVSKAALKDLLLPVPPPPEQTAIATILSDMDAEITALEAKLTKTRQLKQGMMRELLTGRIRLV